jgi:general secretion pathway protein D
MLRAAATLAMVLASTAVAVAHPDDIKEEMYSCGKPKGDFAVSFKPDVELKELVSWAMGFTCKRIIFKSDIGNRASKVTMLTPGKLSAAEALSMFHAALDAMGLAAVVKGEVIEIVESASAKAAALAVRRGFPDGGATVVRLLYRPQHVPVDDLKAALELVISKNGVVAPLPRLGALLITDSGAHVARMKMLVEELDKPAQGDGVYAIPIRHVDATTLVETLKKLIEPDPAGAGAAPAAPAGPRLIVDPRVNAVFVVGSAAEYVRAKSLAAAIDVDVGDAARVHGIKLRHAQAKEIAATLQTLLAGTGTETAGGKRTTTTDSGAGPTGPVRVAADEPSNTLLVHAAPRDAIAVRQIVTDLDAPRRQVYVEAMVLEVEASNTLDAGVTMHGGKPHGDEGSLLVGAVQADGLSSVFPKDTLAAPGLVAGILGAPLEGLDDLLGTTVPSFGVMIRAAAHVSRLDILATPHLMMLDNHKAQISVGARIPYKSTAGAAAATSQYPVAPNIERELVGMTLAITPHVAVADPSDPGAGDSIRLDIELSSEQLGKEDFGDNLGPTWKERGITTSVILRDQDTIVLGGMVDERIEDTVEKIPILGDIPLLGALFRSTHKVRAKSNLLVVITPHLIEDSSAGRALLERRMRERDEFLTAAIDLERRVLEPDVDYRKKRGLLAEIDAAVGVVERERAAIDAARSAPAIDAGRIDGEPTSPASTAD